MVNGGDKPPKTPELDRMAREGSQFTRFHTLASVCSPSRQSRLGWLPFLPTLPGTQASFIVGTFRTAEVSEGDPPLGAFGVGAAVCTKPHSVPPELPDPPKTMSYDTRK